MEKSSIFWILALMGLFLAALIFWAGAESGFPDAVSLEAGRKIRENSTEAGGLSASPTASTAQRLEGEREGGFLPEGRRPRQSAYHFEFTGNEVFSDRVLISAINLPARPPREEEDFAQAVRGDLTAFYRRQGYLSLHIRRIEVAVGNPILVQCELSEGAQNTYGKVTIQSPDPELAGALREIAWQGGPVNVEALSEYTRKVAQQKEAQGYLDYAVDSSVSVDETLASIELKLVVVPSPRYTVGDITYSAGVEPIPGIERLSGQTFSRPALEGLLAQADLPWEAVWLRKDPDAAIVDIRIRSPLPAEQAGQQEP